ADLGGARHQVAPAGAVAALVGVAPAEQDIDRVDAVPVGAGADRLDRAVVEVAPGGAGAVAGVVVLPQGAAALQHVGHALARLGLHRRAAQVLRPGAVVVLV